MDIETQQKLDDINTMLKRIMEKLNIPIQCPICGNYNIYVNSDGTIYCKKC